MRCRGLVGPGRAKPVRTGPVCVRPILNHVMLSRITGLGARCRASTLCRAPSGTRMLAAQAEYPADSAGTDLFNPTEEHGALRDMLRQFVADEVEPQAIEFNREEKFNMPLFRKLGDLGLLGITVPEQYGGSGMDAVAAVIAHEELSSSDPAFCLSFLAHSMLFVNNLAQNGNEAQKHKYLPDVCSGACIGGMGMSEPAVGTDVLGMRTTATKSTDGSTYTLNGAKMWITNGCVSDTELGDRFLVYARTGDGRVDGVSLFLVEKEYPGFKLGTKIQEKCAEKNSTAHNHKCLKRQSTEVGSLEE